MKDDRFRNVGAGFVVMAMVIVAVQSARGNFPLAVYWTGIAAVWLHVFIVRDPLAGIRKARRGESS